MMTLAAFAILLLASVTNAQYKQVDHFSGSNFFDNFQFFTDADPTHGFVQYVNESTAWANNLIHISDGNPCFGVDYTSKLNPNGTGRQSVRLSSNNNYTTGLFILDAAHMPGGICGTWPAWWTLGGDWPNNGEIDILEQANAATSDLSSLHTSANCSISGVDETGKVITSDCYQYDPKQNNTGCGIANYNSASFGAGFNSGGGGVYAMEWTSSWIRVYFFPRNKIPSDITQQSPNPAGWGPPVANFQGDCDIPSHFNSHNIVFDTTFCGDFAGPAFLGDASCKNLASTCNEYVAENPSAFKDAYWAVNYVAVYQDTSSYPTTVKQPPYNSSTVPEQPLSFLELPTDGLQYAVGAGAQQVPIVDGCQPAAAGPTKAVDQAPLSFPSIGIDISI